MTTEHDLLALERQFWTAGADFYREAVDDRCLLAFTGMAGVLYRDQVASTVGEGQRWTDLIIDEMGYLRLRDDVAVLSYKASARRPGGDFYRALVSSGYVRRPGGWKMAFHQQTPLGGN
jgi:hypothetical protein